MKRYEVRWAALDPTRGGEMKKTRPVVIVSLDVLNEHLSTVTVCPLTSTHACARSCRNGKNSDRCYTDRHQHAGFAASRSGD